MNIYASGPHLVVDGVPDFDLSQTLECGQCFRWRRLEGPGLCYEGVARGRYLRLSQQADRLTLFDTPPEEYEGIWRDYFDLGRDYGAIKRQLSRSAVFRRAIGYCPGIRVLRQEPWEALASFLLSQNNNIRRIQGMIDRLCAAFGEEISPGWYAFPPPERLAGLTVEQLAPVRCGFRAKYLLDAAAKVAGGSIRLDEVDAAGTEEARQMLMQIYGVGRKVADCALLYGWGKTDCFPSDVWILRAVRQLFPRGLPQCAQRHAGIAQQYLFHYVRTCPGAVSAPRKKRKKP